MMRRNRGEESHTEGATANTNALLPKGKFKSPSKLQYTRTMKRKKLTAREETMMTATMYWGIAVRVGARVVGREEPCRARRYRCSQLPPPLSWGSCLSFFSFSFSLSFLNPFSQETGKFCQKVLRNMWSSPQGDKPPWIQVIGGNKLLSVSIIKHWLII